MEEQERLIVVDTETTGFDPDTGDRMVEFGAVEIVNNLPTGRKLHLLINPERDVPAEAVKVHGLDNAKLENEPVFAKVAGQIQDFVGSARMVIHNAAFDMKFLNAEMRRVGRPEFPAHQAIDTLRIAKEKFGNSPASLDALCRRFGISTEKRELHGALLDAELLAEVWLGLNGGRQRAMSLTDDTDAQAANGRVVVFNAKPRPHRLAPRVTEADIAAHTQIMATVDAVARKSSKGEFGAIWATADEESPRP